jgi:hypothetical protein
MPVNCVSVELLRFSLVSFFAPFLSFLAFAVAQRRCCLCLAWIALRSVFLLIAVILHAPAPTPHPHTHAHTHTRTHGLKFCVQLAALPASRELDGAVFKDPRNISLVPGGGSVLVADYHVGAPAMQVWPDGTRQRLPSATADATAVLAIDADVDKGLIVVACGENRVERTRDRTGQTVWKRTNLNSPYAAVVAGDVVLVTENGGARVTRLEMGSGMTCSTFGEGTLKRPTGIAVAANGEIVVADWSTKQVYVFDWEGRLLRSLGQGRLQNPHGVSVDGRGRVYVADYNSYAVVVLNGASGAVLATLNVKGNALGVAVTNGGQIVASVRVRRVKGWLGTKRRGMLSVIGSCSSETTL